MKKILFVSALIFFVLSDVSGQTLAEKLSVESCACLGDVKDMAEIEQKAQNCIVQSMVKVLPKDGTFEVTVENVRSLSAEAFQLLGSMCPAVKKIVEKNTETPYKASSSKKSNKHYDEGTQLVSQGNFEQAAKSFRKAIKADGQFVMAIDNLAVCYRRLNRFDDAVYTYKKSLGILPNGEFALVNLGAVYLLQEKYDDARRVYETLRSAHPGDPEGHYGIGRSLLMQNMYEEALPPICAAHVLYSTMRSPRQDETGRIITVIHNEMSAAGKKDAFMDVMKEFDIEFN